MNGKRAHAIYRIIACGMILFGLAACGGGKPLSTTQSPLFLTDIDVPDDVNVPSDIEALPDSVVTSDDPFERFNRNVYWFNAEFDRKIFLPALRAYRFVLPQLARTGIGNFFSNIGELRSGLNGLLQARPDVASRAIIRFAVNSTVGLLGTIDVATRLGVQQQTEDLGQTLGWWGVPSGPFLVLPVLGPSSLLLNTEPGGDVNCPQETNGTVDREAN
ncbi:MAG: VacJ family lipoprotein, partial [Planctomycetota bacterium]